MRTGLQTACLAAFLLEVTMACAGAADDLPRVKDPRLELTPFASDPEVVTPVGVAVDGRGRVFVLESHTHSPPRNYAGPRSDRVKVLEDADRDGRAEKVSVFAEGIEDGMNVAFSPEGVLYVVTSRGVYALHDRDGDGVSEGRIKVLELVTPERPYEHAALLGIAFSHDGWMYVSRGNVGSLRYSMRGTDGTSVSNFGDGGNIVRCRADGSKVEEVATGFWNPFGLGFDRFGRLFCVDNDPDARGPNRLVHVIGGGDYGYKSMFGGGGNHPFQSWNGELPGTLPLAAGLGEAPCGVMDASLAALPGEYRDSVLVTVWGEHNVTRAKLGPRGVSVKGEAEVLVEGGQDFRPVGIAADGEGVIYFADWVRRDYPNHGRGRVWRLGVKTGVETVGPRRVFDRPVAEVGVRRVVELESSRDGSVLEAALSSGDPFERSVAVTALARPEFRERVLSSVSHAKAEVRLGALLALRKAGYEGAETIARRFLTDADPVVRRMALVWVGERGMEALRGEIRRAIEGPGVSAGLFETYLAASECLSAEFVNALRAGTETKANRLPRRLDAGVVESIVRDESAAGELRALALTRLGRPEDRENFEALKKLVRGAEPRLRLEAVRTLATTRHKDAAGVLLGVVADDAAPGDVRAEAVLALASQPGEFARQVLPLLGDRDGAVRVEAARFLRAHVSEAAIRPALEERLKGSDPRLAEQLRFVLQFPSKDRPETVEAWQAALGEGGDPASGARVFQSGSLGCARCHTVNNRGGMIGPDLSNVGQSLDRGKIVRAIVRPSEEYSIDWQAWFVKTRDGDTHLGLQLDLKDEGAIELFTLDGKTTHFKGRDVAGYGTLKQSIMPEGLEAGMSVGDFRDLVAYLESLR